MLPCVVLTGMSCRHASCGSSSRMKACTCTSLSVPLPSTSTRASGARSGSVAAFWLRYCMNSDTAMAPFASCSNLRKAEARKKAEAGAPHSSRHLVATCGAAGAGQ